MPQSPRVERIPRRYHDFSQKIRGEVRNLDRCYQCSICSDGCPVAYTMDYYPNQIIHMVRLGLKEKVLHCEALWICTSCEICATRCPNEIEIVHLMDVLRMESLREGCRSSVNRTSQFHKVFLKEVSARGRINEIRLWLNYKLKTGGLLSYRQLREEASVGLRMLQKGKFRLISRKIHGQREVERIFARTSGKSVVSTEVD